MKNVFGLVFGLGLTVLSGTALGDVVYPAQYDVRDNIVIAEIDTDIVDSSKLSAKGSMRDFENVFMQMRRGDGSHVLRVACLTKDRVPYLIVQLKGFDRERIVLYHGNTRITTPEGPFVIDRKTDTFQQSASPTDPMRAELVGFVEHIRHGYEFVAGRTRLTYSDAKDHVGTVLRKCGETPSAYHVPVYTVTPQSTFGRAVDACLGRTNCTFDDAMRGRR